MIIKRVFFIIFLLFLSSLKNSYAYENKIILKIDNEIITQLDIFNEVHYLKALNPSIKKLEKEKINLIGKNSLIREKIKQKEILKYVKEIKIDQKYLNKLIKSRYYRLNLNSKKEFLDYLKQYNIDLDTIEKKITIEALWNEIIFAKFSAKLKINEEMLRNEIQENKKFKLKSYLLSEILFTLSSKNQLNDKYKTIKEEILINGFENAALEYSDSDSARIGGKLGWIREDALNKIIKKELSSLKVKSITNPIFTPNGYLVLKIEDIKFLEKEYDIEKELKKLVEFKTNQQLNQFSNFYYNKVKKDVTINEL
jgi:peptidyl-prolyl cis-trans isomerase SurA